MEKVLYFVRHCAAKGQAIDADLTEEGKGQAKKLLSFFKDKSIDQVISSPFVRAVKSIEPFAISSNLDLETADSLGERILTTNVCDDWLEKLQESFKNLDLSFEGGESSKEAMKRAKVVLDMLLLNDNKSIVIVSHGNLTTLMLKLFDGRFGFEEWKAMTNPDIHKVHINEKESSVSRIWH